MADPIALTEQERTGLLIARSQIMVAKAAVCDAQIALDKAERDMRIAEERLDSRLLAYADSHEMKGNVRLSDDGESLLAG